VKAEEDEEEEEEEDGEEEEEDAEDEDEEEDGEGEDEEDDEEEWEEVCSCFADCWLLSCDFSRPVLVFVCVLDYVGPRCSTVR
jgi:hypothetical protein